MSTIINATTTNGVVIQPDNSGSLVLQTNSGTTALTIDTSQNVAFAKGFTVGATAAPAFSATFNANQSINSGAFVKLQFNTENFDTNSNYDSTTNYRFTPTVAGYYLFTAQAQFNLPASSVQNILALYKNGSNYAYITNINQAGSFPCPNGSILVSMNGSTDYVEIYGYQQSGSATIVTNPAYFSGFLVRSL